MNQLVVRRTSGSDLVREVLLPAACLIAGMVVAWLAVRHAAGVLAGVNVAVEVVGRANHEMWERIGWTWVVLLPLALWLLALFLATFLRVAGVTTTPRGSLSRQLEVIRELAPMIGMFGTISGLAEATRSMNADNVESSLLGLAPAVGHALYSTMAGLSLAIVAYVLSRLNDSRGGGAVVMLVLASAVALGAPARAEAAQEAQYRQALSMAVSPAPSRVAGSHRRARPSAAQPRDSLRRLIHRVARREGVDPLFAEALARSESGLNPRAVSPNGCCRGLFQLHHVTAQELGVRNVFDATENATGGIRYFRRLARRFGSVALALVAYNAGPTVAQRWVVNPAGTDVPSETTRFVEHVISTYRRLRTPRIERGPMTTTVIHRQQAAGTAVSGRNVH